MNKRKNSELSPESIENQSKEKIYKMNSTTVANLSVGDLRKILLEMNQESLKDIEAKLNVVSNTVTALSEENKELKVKIEKMSIEAEQNRRNIVLLEDQIKRKNLIFKGLPSENNLGQAMNKVLKENLKIDTPVHMKSTRKLSDRNGLMGIVVEFDDEQQVSEIIKNTRNLAGSRIAVERDLNHERQENKKAMLQLRRNILETDNSQRVQVKDDRMKIDNTILFWNREKKLMNGQQNGKLALEKIYGKEKIKNLDLNFYNLLPSKN